jgi:hypothetical protein
MARIEPLAINCVARVIINDGIRQDVIIKPLRRPIKAPQQMPDTMAGRTLPVAFMTIAAMTPEKAATEPAERSTSPEIKTICDPKAIITTTAFCRSTLLKFLNERNTGLNTDEIMTTPSSMANMPKR